MEMDRLGRIERQFAGLIWKNAPLSSGELVKLSEAELSWKKSTTYTVLRKLCQKGLFENEDGMVRVLISEEEYQSLQSSAFVEETFHGSLPQFLTAFTRGKKLSKEEIAELEALIAQSRNGGE